MIYTVSWLLVHVTELVWVFLKLKILWDFHKQQSPAFWVFTQFGLGKKKLPLFANDIEKKESKWSTLTTVEDHIKFLQPESPAPDSSLWAFISVMVWFHILSQRQNSEEHLWETYSLNVQLTDVQHHMMQSCQHGAQSHNIWWIHEENGGSLRVEEELHIVSVVLLKWVYTQ